MHEYKLFFFLEESCGRSDLAKQGDFGFFSVKVAIFDGEIAARPM